MEWFKKLGKRFKRSEKGQGMVEYGLILALVSVVAIGSLGDVGDKITDAFDSVKTEVSDNSGGGGEQAPDEGGEEVIPGEGEGGVVEEDAAVAPPGYTKASDDDFEFVKDNQAPNTYDGVRGYYKYIGTDEFVAVPHKIHGNQITDMYRMFMNHGVKGVSNDNLNITNMEKTFFQSGAKHLDLSNLETGGVTNMLGMFWYSKSESIDLSGFDTSNVETMVSMFHLSKIRGHLDLSGFDTSKVKDMSRMFTLSTATTIDVSRFNTKSVTSFESMYESTKIKTLDLNHFNTDEITSFKRMFANAEVSNLKINKWYAGKAGNGQYAYDGMFSRVSNLTSVNIESMFFRNVGVSDIQMMFFQSSVRSVKVFNRNAQTLLRYNDKSNYVHGGDQSNPNGMSITY